MAQYGKGTERKITAAERRKKALEFRKAGMTYEQIAGQLGVTTGAAHKSVMTALKEIREKQNEAAEDVLAIELERLDTMLIGILPAARKGNQGAIDRVLRIMDRRAKYLGLDAPAKQDITSSGEPIKMIEVIKHYPADEK